MRVRVPQCVVDQAIRCTKALACLSDEAATLCPVELCIEGEVHFVRCLEDMPCSYRSRFGEGFICNCPVRKEIYNRTGL